MERKLTQLDQAVKNKNTRSDSAKVAAGGVEVVVGWFMVVNGYGA